MSKGHLKSGWPPNSCHSPNKNVSKHRLGAECAGVLEVSQELDKLIVMNQRSAA